jgi:hypothetical protein
VPLRKLLYERAYSSILNLGVQGSPSMVNGVGLRTLSRRRSWVQIPPPAPLAKESRTMMLRNSRRIFENKKELDDRQWRLPLKQTYAGWFIFLSSCQDYREGDSGCCDDDDNRGDVDGTC